ncbi:hypothetical protein CalGV047 [Clostera anastomosis granulovirus A]|uniref:Uncharacterized protein n=1 Tax=Clostera anastomosis granulovirus A TaxID=1986289 RepID=U5KB45_9BBAC|nr:hypothetical protein CalGV047 [Clostera anastomosis granulovirus Henan]AGQ20306.1 hypothetical protein CalGV047 [Clostera anastomosis granulovirus Henan]
MEDLDQLDKLLRDNGVFLRQVVLVVIGITLTLIVCALLYAIVLQNYSASRRDEISQIRIVGV